MIAHFAHLVAFISQFVEAAVLPNHLLLQHVKLGGDRAFKVQFESDKGSSVTMLKLGLHRRSQGALWLIVILVSIVAVIGGASLDLRGDPGTLAASVLASASKIRLAFVMILFGKICYLGVTVLRYEPCAGRAEHARA